MFQRRYAARDGGKSASFSRTNQRNFFRDQLRHHGRSGLFRDSRVSQRSEKRINGGRGLETYRYSLRDDRNGRKRDVGKIDGKTGNDFFDKFGTLYFRAALN